MPAGSDTARDFTAQSDEIRFFMEKGFQASFGYLASLVAFLAASNSRYVDSAAQAVDMPLRSLVSIVVLAANLFYFVVVISCLFAVVKRGLFILTVGRDEISGEWEVFARDGTLVSGFHRPFGLPWNIDNYYMVPLLLVLAVGSLGAFWFGFEVGPTHARAIITALFLMHFVPVSMLYYLVRLNQRCRELVPSTGQAPAGDTAVPDTAS